MCWLYLFDICIGYIINLVIGRRYLRKNLFFMEVFFMDYLGV